VIGIRVLAAGALGGVADRHPIAAPAVDPLATGPDYAADVRRAQVLRVLAEEGHVQSLVEASVRFPLGNDAVSTVLVGYSSLEQLELAQDYASRGPLPRAVLRRLAALWNDLARRRRPACMPPRGGGNSLISRRVSEYSGVLLWAERRG